MDFKFINKLPIVSFIIKFILRKIKDKRSAEVNSIPKYLLKKEHSLNGTILANREHLLEMPPKQGVVAEVEMNSGDFTENNSFAIQRIR